EPPKNKIINEEKAQTSHLCTGLTLKNEPCKNKVINEEKAQTSHLCTGLTLKNEPCKNKIIEGKYCRFHRPKSELEKDAECPICMENLDNVTSPLSCGHWVHMNCIVAWGKQSCPICRQVIVM